MEQAKQQTRLGLILASAGLVVAVAAGAVLFIVPRSAGISIVVLVISLLAIGMGFAATRLAARAREVVLVGQAGRKNAELSGIVGWIGLVAGAWVLVFMLTILASTTEVQMLIGLGEVLQTLLIIVLAAVFIAAYTYLVLGVVLNGRRWTLTVTILHLISGVLGIVAGALTLINSYMLVQALAPFKFDAGSLQGKEGTFGPLALVYGVLHTATGLLFLTKLGNSRWVRIASALLNTVAAGYSIYLAGTALGQRAWVVVALAVVSFLLAGLAMSIALPESKTRYSLPFVLLSPAIVGLCLLVVYPMGYEIRLAFSNMSLKYFKNPTYNLAEGWANFKEVFTMPVLKQAMFLPRFKEMSSTVDGVTRTFTAFQPGLLLQTLLWTGIQVPCHVIGGLVLALLLNRKMKLRGLYRALLVIPWALPPIVAVLAWRGEFHYEYGFFNIMLRGLGLAAVQWKSNPTANFVAMNLVNIWLGIPFMMVILLGGLQSIPGELYEAAEIDGASWWQQFRKITMPLLQPVMTPAIILGVIWTFNNFNVPFFINENELESSDILVTALFRAAFQYNQYGFAAAFALVIFAILLIFSIFYINVTGTLRGVTDAAPKPRRRRALRRAESKGGSEK